MIRTKHQRHWPGRLALLLCLVLVAVIIWFLPAFRLQAVEVQDLRSIDEKSLIEASGLSIGQHLFTGLGNGSLARLTQLRYPEVENRLIKAFPSIKTIIARMDFPGKISLTVEERVEVAYVSIPDGCVMIDKEGVALKIWPQAPEKIPVIEGVTATSLILGQPLEVNVPSSMNSAITLMGAIIEADQDTRTELSLLPQIRKIRPLSGRRLYLTVILPNTGEELTVLAETGQQQTEDMLWLRFALAQGAFDSRGKGVLDLTGNRRTFTPD